MGIIYILLVVMGITSVAFIARLSARKGVTPLDLTFILFLAATVLGYFWAAYNDVPSGAYSKQLLLIAALAGAGGAGAVFVFNHAIRIGHFGFSNAIYRSSFLIPVIVSFVVFNTKVHWLAASGILLILVSIFLISWSNDSFGRGRKTEFIWFLVIVSAFLLSGLPRIGQLLISRNKLNPSAYLFASYAAGFLLLMVFNIFSGKFRINKWAAIYGSIAAFASFVGVYCTIAALASLPAFVVFPVTLSAPIMLGMLISRLLKEKTTIKGWIGVAVGLTGILILALYLYN